MFLSRIRTCAATAMLVAFIIANPVSAQQRGQYPSGIFAVNSGVMPDPGWSYANIFYYDSSTRFKGPNGQPIPVNGQYAIMADNNLIVYVYSPKFLGGFLGSMVDVPIATGSLDATVFAAGHPVTGGGGGIADTYFAPIEMGWHLPHLDAQVGLGVIAPTGRYTPGASNNIGTGYWTYAAQAGATVYLTKNKATSLNAFNFYSWNSTQRQTNVTPGQNESLDFSLLQILPLAKDKTYLLQIGPVGYGQWQTSNRGGVSNVIQNPGLSTAIANSRFGVQALGFAANVVAPTKKLLIGASSFWEMGAYNTREGHVVMITAALKL